MRQQNLSKETRHWRSTRNMGRGSSLDLESVIRHLPDRNDGCIHLMVYPWRPRQIAEVSILQSQLHSVNGLKASGDLTILPLSSITKDLGTKTVLLSAECAGYSTTLQHMFVRAKQNPRTQPSRTPAKAVRNSIRAEADSFFEAMRSSNSILSITQRMSSGAFLNIPKDIFTFVMPRALGACLENRTPNNHTSFFQIDLRCPKDDRLHQ